MFIGERAGEGTHALYDAATGQVIQKAAEPEDERQLPPWAKSTAQLQDESVPEGAPLAEERTKWIAKVLREISTIQPRMTRKDLLKVFTTGGGFSRRWQRTYMPNTH